MPFTTMTIGVQGSPEAITLTPVQAKFLFGLLSDPAEVAQIVAYLAYDLGLETETIEIEPTPAPENPDFRFTGKPQHIQYDPSDSAEEIEPTPTPKPEPKPKAARKPRKTKTAPTVVIVDTLRPIPGISAEHGKTIPSPTATCAVSSPSPTPNVASGAGVEKIASASLERDLVNDRGMTELRQRAKEVGVTGAIHKMKAETLRAKIALEEEKLAAKPVAAPVQVKPVAAKPARKLVADFLNVLLDGRELYTAVYDDGSIENEMSAADVSVAA